MHGSFRSPVLVLVAPGALSLAACSIQRVQTASAAQTAVVGLSKADVLAYMGVPQTKTTEGNVEVWDYQSGNGRADSYFNSYSNTTDIAVDATAARSIDGTTHAAVTAAGTHQTNSYRYGSLVQGI